MQWKRRSNSGPMVGAASSPTITRSPTCAAARRALPATCIQHGAGNRPVVIGYDKRFASREFCGRVRRGAGRQRHPRLADRWRDADAGHLVCGRCTTRRRARSTSRPRTIRRRDNGFKVRDPNGGAIDPDGLKEIEALIPGQRRTSSAAVEGGDERRAWSQVFDASLPLPRAHQRPGRSGADQERRAQDRRGADVGQRRGLVSRALLAGGKTDSDRDSQRAQSDLSRR